MAELIQDEVFMAFTTYGAMVILKMMLMVPITTYYCLTRGVGNNSSLLFYGPLFHIRNLNVSSDLAHYRSGFWTYLEFEPGHCWMFDGKLQPNGVELETQLHAEEIEIPDSRTLSLHTQLTHSTVRYLNKCHQNDLENIIPFVVVSLLYTLSGPELSAALLHFFASCWIFHTTAYIGVAQQGSVLDPGHSHGLRTSRTSTWSSDLSYVLTHQPTVFGLHASAHASAHVTSSHISTRSLDPASAHASAHGRRTSHTSSRISLQSLDVTHQPTVSGPHTSSLGLQTSLIIPWSPDITHHLMVSGPHILAWSPDLTQHLMASGLMAFSTHPSVCQLTIYIIVSSSFIQALDLSFQTLCFTSASLPAVWILHTIAYIAALPHPSRGLSWILGMLVTFSMAHRTLSTMLLL
ncbi:microsomal glutathione S-transferase 1.2 [Thunnus maccoyii]|uniref:microsomal glutathione S-transferase 1.2 n=1 Tax=Thunnus maccoyii TaxID=8240 RepID=UPI001C4A9895|nr:microsomal glutathione S-transferase 1.2 [Thunnus maccoyii]